MGLYNNLSPQGTITTPLLPGEGGVLIEGFVCIGGVDLTGVQPPTSPSLFSLYCMRSLASSATPRGGTRRWEEVWCHPSELQAPCTEEDPLCLAGSHKRSVAAGSESSWKGTSETLPGRTCQSCCPVIPPGAGYSKMHCPCPWRFHSALVTSKGTSKAKTWPSCLFFSDPFLGTLFGLRP